MKEIKRRFKKILDGPNAREDALALIDKIRNELLTTQGLLFRETGG